MMRCESKLRGESVGGDQWKVSTLNLADTQFGFSMKSVDTQWFGFSRSVDTQFGFSMKSVNIQFGFSMKCQHLI